MMDIHDIVDMAIPRRELNAKCEVRKDYHCEHCGFTGVARATGLGSAQFTALTDDSYLEAEAYSRAVAKASDLLSLLVCPQCGKRTGAEWAQFQRETRITQGAVAAGWITIIALAVSQDPHHPIGGVFLLLPAAVTLFSVSYVRNIRAEVAEKAVTFLSREEIAAEAEQAAKEAAEREEARRARARQSTTSKKKRSRFK